MRVSLADQQSTGGGSRPVRVNLADLQSTG